MSRDLNDLTHEFRRTARQWLADLPAAGVDAVPYFTLRTADEQAALWRSTRTRAEIDARVAELRAKGAGYVADVIERVGPQYPGPNVRGHVTHAVPGQSWHQFREALDVYVRGPGGVIAWHHEDPGFDQYETAARLARDAGLEAGWFWRRKDPGHVQLRRGSPLSVYGSWARLSEALRSVSDE